MLANMYPSWDNLLSYVAKRPISLWALSHWLNVFRHKFPQSANLVICVHCTYYAWRSSPRWPDDQKPRAKFDAVLSARRDKCRPEHGHLSVTSAATWPAVFLTSPPSRLTLCLLPCQSSLTYCWPSVWATPFDLGYTPSFLNFLPGCKIPYFFCLTHITPSQAISALTVWYHYCCQYPLLILTLFIYGTLTTGKTEILMLKSL